MIGTMKAILALHPDEGEWIEGEVAAIGGRRDGHRRPLGGKGEVKSPLENSPPEAPYEGSGPGPYGMATVIFGLSLLILAEALGWPSADEVVAIFERYP
jgi:hypothetical protein